MKVTFSVSRDLPEWAITTIEAVMHTFDEKDPGMVRNTACIILGSVLPALSLTEKLAIIKMLRDDLPVKD